MKELTIQDATKDELIQYFFTPSGFGGGNTIPCRQDNFLLWLKQKRDGETMDAIETSMDASQKALHEYVELVK
jgi:hypothetical protein